MKHRQPGLFDVEERAAQLTQMGDPLVGLKARIDWEAFRPELNRIHEKDRKSQAGSAYRSEAQEQRLADADIESQVCEKGTRGKPLTEEQKLSNRTKSKVRARVEHVFGAQAAMGGHWVRTIGLQRTIVKISLMNLVYNMMRLIQLIKCDANATKRDLLNQHREGAPVVA